MESGISQTNILKILVAANIYLLYVGWMKQDQLVKKRMRHDM